MKKVAGKLKLSMAQFRELEAFAQFGSDLDEATQKQLNLGRRLTEVLKQGQYEPMPVAQQVAILYAAINGYLDDIEVEEINKFESEFHKYLTASGKAVLDQIKKAKDLDEKTEKQLKKVIEDFKKQYIKS